MRTPYEPPAGDLALPNILHALSDPIRLEIVRRLAEEERVCGTFEFAIAKSTLSHHLKLLREAGITRTRVDGVRRVVSLRRQDLEARAPGLLDAILAAHADVGDARL
ncbi:MAG: helix-turn-helix transcriptional regulator [Chloroflexota bacterium]